MTATTSLASARSVTRRFGELVAVDDVSLEIGAGEVVGLLGANGAGKTTLIRLLLGLLPVSSGSVELLGGPPSRATRRRLGYVPQGLGVWSDLTVGENVRFSTAAFATDMRRDAMPAGLAEVWNRPAGEIGLGRQRQLAFACALAHAPELLVLDEPTSGVDPLARARLWDEVREHADRGTGVLVTTHYLEEAHQCDRLIIMAAGRVVARGTLVEVIGDARTVRVRAASWERAFDALSDAGLLVTLTGREIRIAGSPVAHVADILEASDVAAQLDEIPASLEETMSTLQR